MWRETLDAAPSRAQLLRLYRVMTLVRAAATDVDALDGFAEDVREAGIELQATA